MVATPEASHKDSLQSVDEEDSYPGNDRIATPTRSVAEQCNSEGVRSLGDRDILTPELTEVDGCDSSLVEQVVFEPYVFSICFYPLSHLSLQT